MTKIAGVAFSQPLSKTQSWRPLFIWVAAACFYFYEIILLVSPSIMTDPLMAELNASGEQLGHLAAFYYYAYAFMQIPVGILMDRFGPRILLTIGAVLCSVSCFMFGGSTTIWFAELSRLIMGVGGSFALVGTLKIASMWFPLNRFALLTGLMLAVGMMGAVVGQAPVAMLVKAIGWRDALFFAGAFGAILSFFIWWLMGQSVHKNNKLIQDILPGLLQLIRHPALWLISIYVGLMFIPTTGFGQLWGVSYIESTYGVSTESAAWIVSMLFLGWALGAPFYGWLSDKIGKRNPLMALATILTILVMMSVLYLPKPIIVMQILVFLLGFFSSGFILAFSVGRELMPLHLTGTAMGFIHTISYATGALAQPILGKILDNHACGMVNEYGVRLFMLADYQYALSLIPICLFGALLLIMFVKETNCQPVAHL